MEGENQKEGAVPTKVTEKCVDGVAQVRYIYSARVLLAAYMYAIAIVPSS